MFLNSDNEKVHKSREGLKCVKRKCFSTMKKSRYYRLANQVKFLNVSPIPKNGVVTRVDIAEPNWHPRPLKGPDELVGV
jgi:hypothetical protein